MKAFLYCLLTLRALWSFSQNHYERAQNYYEQGFLDSANYFIKLALRRNPSVDDYYLSALIHEEQALDLRALADYHAAINLDPNHLESYFQSGLIYQEKGNHEQAIKHFSHVIENGDSGSTNAIYFANDAFGVRRTSLATLQSMKAVLYKYRASSYAEIGKYDLALLDIKNAISLDEHPDFYLELGLIHLALNKKSQAKNSFIKAISIDSTHYLSWYNLLLVTPEANVPKTLLVDEFIPMLNLKGYNALVSQDLPLAISHFSNVLDIDSLNKLALLNRGKAYLQASEFESAEVDFKTLLKLDASNFEALYLLGNTYFNKKEFDEAIGFYEAYLSIDQGYDLIWYNSAMAYLSTNNDVKACHCLKKANLLGMEEARKMLKTRCH